MLYRKIEDYIKNYLLSDDDKILCIDGARQVGKSFIIRHLASTYFPNYVEINMVDDFNGDKLFLNANTIEKFYLQLSVIAGDKLKDRNSTIIFIDEIQVYPHLLTLLKSLRQDNRYKYICSGSLLGVTLKKSTSIPIGTIIEKHMYPLDFEEFIIANGVGKEVINHLKYCFDSNEEVEESLHNYILNLFKTYLFVGGLPDAVNEYLETKNIFNIREIQKNIQNYYGDDASKYDNANKLKIKRIYDFIPSNIENKVKRIKFVDIEESAGSRSSKYENEFEYLISSGICIEARAISEPKFPLIQSSNKNLIKLYLNDIGLLTNILYQNNINAILQDKSGVNLGAVYESVVAQELKAHDYSVFYYDRRKVGEVDYLVNDYDNLSILPIEVKSGKDVSGYRALNKIVSDVNYNVKKAYVFSNNKEVIKKGNIIHLPIYFIMFV